MTEKIRPPFVWTPRQEIDPRGSRSVYLGEPRRPDEKNRWFFFRRIVDLAAEPDEAKLSITVDGRYHLFVNGVRTGRGPVRCSPLYQRFDSYDLSGSLSAGRNIIGVLVHTYGIDTAFYETTKGMWQPTFGDGGLWVDGHMRIDGETVHISTTDDWRCTQSDAWTREMPQSNHSLGFIEDLDATKLPTEWTSLDFDDADWDIARPMIAGGGEPESTYGGMETRPFPVLLPRGIPQLEDRPVVAKRIVWIRGLLPEPEQPFYQRIYQERLVPAAENAVRNADDLLQTSDGATVVRTSRGGDVSILLDFGKIMTGHPRIEIEARGGEIVEIACSESLPGEWSPEGLAPDARPTPKPWLGLDSHCCRYRARAGRQAFERFEWCAIRWMQVNVRNAPDGLTIRNLGATIANYPVEERGRFQSSDTFLDMLWSTGAYTLRQCMHDAWEDCPSREQRQWLGDVTVENLVGHAAFGPCVAPLTAKYLAQAAESQRPDGLTQMFAPGDHKVDGTLIPDWTLQWILAAADHWRLTGDRDTIDAIYPSMLKALAWFERLIDPSGLVADMPYWHFMDWAGVGRKGEAAALNAQLAGSFRAAAELGSAVGWKRAAERCSARAQSISRALETRHWDARRRVYVDVVDPVSGGQDLRVSQHANAAIALWGESLPQRIATALDRIVDARRLTFTAAPPIAPEGETLDPEEGVVLANTFYSHFVYEALAKHGRLSDALQLMRQRFGPMLARGATTLWESFEPTASLCHGFSASPTYQLSHRILGVSPALPGYDRIAFAPDLVDLEYAEGVVPTRHGDVQVRLERDGLGFVAKASSTGDASIEFRGAPGLKLNSLPTKVSSGFEARYVRT
ncbi:MAG: alpha-L-rhamnosidase N-terminal domain-containing protein [Rhizomicrobium sp.]